MSYQRERDTFIARMEREGLSLETSTALLRAATTLQRYAELSCSSEAADRDRVPCPAIASKHQPCVCGGEHNTHQTVPRIDVQGARLERRIVAMMPDGWRLDTQGDPRGYVLRVVPPSYAERNAGRDRHNQDTIGVPSGPTRLRF